MLQSKRNFFLCHWNEEKEKKMNERKRKSMGRKSKMIKMKKSEKKKNAIINRRIAQMIRSMTKVITSRK